MKILNIFLAGIVLQTLFVAEHHQPQIDRQQAISLEVGFIMGSKLALLGLPLEMRNKSFAGISYDTADLERLLSELQIKHSELMLILERVNAASVEYSPLKAADILFEGTNRLNALLNSKNADLMHTNRIGFVLGYMLENVSIMLAGRPQKNHLDQFNKSSAPWRKSLSRDIEQSKLSPQIKKIIIKTKKNALTVRDLKDIKIECIKILNIALKAKNEALQ